MSHNISVCHLELALGPRRLQELLDDLGVAIGQNALACVDVLLRALADDRHIVDLRAGQDSWGRETAGQWYVSMI